VKKAGKRTVSPVVYKRKDRFGIALTGFMAFGFGVGTLLRGRILYQNWWGGAVYAPFAILVGLIALGIASYGKYPG
jgi:hypothetical protein